MKPSIRTLALGTALSLALASLAHAGGAGVSVERAKDGKYLVHSFACTGPSSVSIVATAEGVVNGERESIPLKLKPMKEPGLYQFERTWPAQGTWLVRMEMSGTHNLVTLFALAKDGRVAGSEYVAEGDGRHECDLKLAANAK
jgi:hypothetical protein